MQGLIGARMHSEALGSSAMYNRAVGSSGAEQGFYLLKNHNKLQHFHQLGTLEEGLPASPMLPWTTQPLPHP